MEKWVCTVHVYGCVFVCGVRSFSNIPFARSHHHYAVEFWSDEHLLHHTAHIKTKWRSKVLYIYMYIVHCTLYIVHVCVCVCAFDLMQIVISLCWHLSNWIFQFVTLVLFDIKSNQYNSHDVNIIALKCASLANLFTVQLSISISRKSNWIQSQCSIHKCLVGIWISTRNSCIKR